MLEKQRVHLEELIDDLVRTNLEAAQHFGTDKGGMAMEARSIATKAVSNYISFIQSYMGTQRCASCGCTPNQLSSDVELGPCDCWECTKRREVLNDE